MMCCYSRQWMLCAWCAKLYTILSTRSGGKKSLGFNQQKVVSWWYSRDIMKHVCVLLMEYCWVTLWSSKISMDNHRFAIGKSYQTNWAIVHSILAHCRVSGDASNAAPCCGCLVSIGIQMTAKVAVRSKCHTFGKMIQLPFWNHT